MGKYCRSHIGKTFNDAKLVVVDGGDKYGYVKVKCSVCAKDPELFGDGVFETAYGSCEKGSLPCGCAKKFYWTLPQYEIRIKRKIIDENLDIEFVGFGNRVSSLNSTPVKLFCNKSLTEYEVYSIYDFFSGKGNRGKTFSAEERIAMYNKDNSNYIVWDSGKKTGFNVVCGFYCKICENRGFESLFEINSASLFSGQIPCYCSSVSKRITGDHIVEITKTKLNIQKLSGVEVIGAYRKKEAWYSVFLCNTHGVYSRNSSDLNKTGCHCLKCNPPLTGYDKTKQGSLYLLEIQTDSGTILGYGITNKLNNRLTTHRKNLKELGYKILSTRIFEGSGTKVLSVESAIKALHKTGLIDCEGFRRESISIDRKEEVLLLCAGLK